MSRDRRPDDLIADFGTVDREADEPDRDDLGSLASGDADWVMAAERATGRRLRPAATDDVTREFWGESPGWRSSGPVGRTGRRPASGRTAAVTAGTSDAVADAGDATAARGRLSRWASGLRRPAPKVPPGGRVERTRSHRVVTSDDTRASHDDPRDGASEDQRPGPDRADADRAGAPPAVELEPVGPGHGGPTRPRTASTFAERTGLDAVDPLIRRLGALLLIGVLIVPVALALRSPSTERDTAIRSLASGELADWLPISALGRSGRTGDSGVTADATGRAADGGAAGVAGSNGDGGADGSDGEAAGAGSPGDPGTAASACEIEYTIGSGDYWLRLAEEAGVDLDQLLRANDATIETAIHPGDDVCLPAAAEIPSPPPSTADDGDEGEGSSSGPSDVTASQGGDTGAGDGSGSSGGTASSAGSTTPATSAPATSAPATSPPSTTAPATTAPPTTAAPATTAPATTSPPDTTSPAVSANPSEEQVRAIIREVFPADQHETAFKVARRESGFRADADNGWCCHGIFQIHWQAHRSWLNDRGITSVEQLYDARTNVELAYEIYERAGGWGPWSATAY